MIFFFSSFVDSFRDFKEFFFLSLIWWTVFFVCVCFKWRSILSAHNKQMTEPHHLYRRYSLFFSFSRLIFNISSSNCRPVCSCNALSICLDFFMRDDAEYIYIILLSVFFWRCDLTRSHKRAFIAWTRTINAHASWWWSKLNRKNSKLQHTHRENQKIYFCN